MDTIIGQLENIGKLSSPALLAAMIILIGYFYRRDFIKERKNNIEDKLWQTNNQKALIGIIEKDMESRDRNSESHQKLATSIEGLNSWLRGKLE